jgi:hypothetical protein
LEVPVQLNLSGLTKGLQYHGDVIGKRQRYFVFSSPSQYLILSMSRTKPGAGNFNVVPRKAVAYLQRRLAGRMG